MDGRADLLAGSLLSVDRELEREFEGRLAESAALTFRVAFSVLRQREDAEDVAQETMTKAFRKIGQLREPSRLRAWLVRTAWRAALDRRRSDKRRLSREAEAAGDPVRTADEAAAAAQRSAHLWAAIDALPEKLRLVTVLAAIEGHDLRAVAAVLGLPEGTVKSRLFLARRQLKESLQWMRTTARG